MPKSAEITRKKIVPPHRTNAFTLIELLVVIVIIGILATLAMVSIPRVTESARRTKCLANLRQIGMALKTYANDNNQLYPLTTDATWTTWDKKLLNSGLLTKEVFACPSDKNFRIVPGDRRSYGYNGYFGDVRDDGMTIKGVAMQINKNLSEVILVADSAGPSAVINCSDYASVYRNAGCLSNHKREGANYLFCDLHASWMKNSGDYGQPLGSDGEKLWRKHWPCLQ